MMKTLQVFTLISLMACSSPPAFDLQGHRGCRGLLPENSIPGFIKAVELGVTTLELDLAVTADGQLVVSHEPYMSAIICATPAGEPVTDSTQLQHNIYQMTYEEVATYDCGSREHPAFPQQVSMPVFKPLLAAVIDTVEAYVQQRKLPMVSYNIEIKSHPRGDSTYHPAPARFSDLVYHFLNNRLPWERITIQSFDFRVLQYFKATYPEVRLAALVENEEGVQTNLDQLGFQPDIYSSYFRLMTKETVDSLHDVGIQVIPWTVNDTTDMRRLVEWEVDGLITDYPDRFQQAFGTFAALNQ